MSIHIKTGDKWHTCASVHVNVSGTWHTCKQIYVNVSGTWHKCILITKSATITCSSPLGHGTGNAYKATLSNVKNGSTITITGNFSAISTDHALLIGATGATLNGGKSGSWSWSKFSPTSQKQYLGVTHVSKNPFSITAKATSTSVVMELCSTTNLNVTGCKIAYTQEGYFD